MRIDICERFHHQRFVRVDQNLAVGADKKGITHTVEIQGIDTVGNGLQAQITASDALGLPGLADCVDDGDHQVAGRGIDIRFGDGRAAAVDRILVPGAGTRVVAFRHPGVWIGDELTVLISHVGGDKGRRQGLLLQQQRNVFRRRIDRHRL
ncbi:hypothetical protein D3C87_1644810 [compost metagenome]